MNVRKFLGGISLVAALALTACGGGASEGGGAATGSGGAGTGGGATLNVEGNTALKFVPDTLQAAAGQPISVAFNNTAPVQHNWVLVQPGKEQAVSDAAAAKGGDATGVDGVIVAGKVLDGGANETITVPAQQAGTYPYICTVPGHYPAGMKGTLTIQ